MNIREGIYLAVHKALTEPHDTQETVHVEVDVQDDAHRDAKMQAEWEILPSTHMGTLLVNFMDKDCDTEAGKIAIACTLSRILEKAGLRVVEGKILPDDADARQKAERDNIVYCEIHQSAHNSYGMRFHIPEIEKHLPDLQNALHKDAGNPSNPTSRITISKLRITPPSRN